METAVQEVNQGIPDWKAQDCLSTLAESSCRDRIEFNKYADHGIFVANTIIITIPESLEELSKANATLCEHGFILMNGESLALEVANSRAFKSIKKGFRV